MYDEILWRKKVKENFIKIKRSASAEFKDDQML